MADRTQKNVSATRYKPSLATIPEVTAAVQSTTRPLCHYLYRPAARNLPRLEIDPNFVHTDGPENSRDLMDPRDVVLARAVHILERDRKKNSTK